MSGLRVVPAGSCNVSPELNSQWRNSDHWHAVWPDDQHWCYETQEAATERAVEVHRLWLGVATWEPISSRGKVVYWRLTTPDGVLLGAVTKTDDGTWRARRSGAGRRLFTHGRDLGRHPSWQAARRAVVDSVKAGPA